MMVNFVPLAAEIDCEFGAPQQISTGLAFWLRYCSDVAQRKSTKLCTMFARRLNWYNIHKHLGTLASWRNFATRKIHFVSKFCVLLYWHRYCTALEQWVSAKLCGVVQGMELRNFRRRHHLYSAGRPSRWVSAHISSFCSYHSPITGISLYSKLETVSIAEPLQNRQHAQKP